MIGRRPPSVPDRLDALEAAVAEARGRLDEEAVAMADLVAERARHRIGHGSSHTLVALLGATGGGKSSLTNAVVGTDVATTGVRRPTTTSTLACVWGPDDAGSLLDWLEVPNRHQVPGPSPALDGLVLLDVPDHDSVERANREEMERIAEHADALVWVTDPEKYGDEALHAYLRRLHRHGRVTAMVITKIDLLSPDDLQQCRRDLARLVEADGIPDVRIVGTSTATGAGIDELVGVLAHTVNDRRAMLDRIEADVAVAASELLTALGPDGGADRVPRKVGQTLTQELVTASGLSTVTTAVRAGHRRDAAASTGWPFTRWARSLRPHPLRRLHLDRGSAGRSSLPEPSGVQRARTEGAVRSAVGLVAGALPEPWPAVIRAAATPDPQVLADRLDQAVTGAVRARVEHRPRWWRLVNGLQLALAVAAVAGLGWLTLLAAGAYLQLPDVPTPDYRGIPIPTGLLVGGVVLGLLLAVVSSRLAAVGASRRARAVRAAAEGAVSAVADELILHPLQAELDHRNQLRSLLERAGGSTTHEARSEATAS